VVGGYTGQGVGRRRRSRLLHQEPQLSGALVRSDCDLRLHTLIDVRIELPPPTTRIAVVKAHISRKLQEGVGIEWCEFAPTIVKDLLRSRLIRFPL
jgi:hypothetical protein